MGQTTRKSWVDRIDGFQRKHPLIGFPLAVIYKYFDDQGNMLAALMTFYAFLSIFPILLLTSSILGFVFDGDPDLQRRILNAGLRQFPVLAEQIKGDQLNDINLLSGSTPAIIVGLIGALYGASRVAAFTQYAMHIAWMVPRNSRPNPVAVRMRGLLLIATAGVAILIVTAISALSDNLPLIGVALGGEWKVLVTIAIIIVETFVFVLLFRLGSARPHSTLTALPGAFVTAIGWHSLQLLGSSYVNTVIGHSSITNGIFVIIIGMFAWMYLGAMIVVIGAEVNVVRAYRLYPRALLTPFTDNVDLTDADKRAYTRYAQRERTKDYARIHVGFDYDGQYKSRPPEKDQLTVVEGEKRDTPEEATARTKRIRRRRRRDG